MDENLVHCSYEAGILEDPDRTPVSAFDHFLHFGAVSGNVL
jgi:argininosuccinate synthase